MRKNRSQKRSAGSAFAKDNDKDGQSKSKRNDNESTNGNGDGSAGKLDRPGEGLGLNVPGISISSEQREEPELQSTSTPTPSTSTAAPPAPARNAAGICFKNELILSKIAKGLPAKALLAVRQLSPEWNEASVPELHEKHSPIRISSDNLPRKDKTTKMKVYTTEMLKSLRFPFTKHTIDLDTCPKTLGLFNLFGHSMSSLRILEGHGEEINIHMLRQIIFDKAPQLKNLELIVRSGRPVSGVKHQRTPLPRELPGLKSLQVVWIGASSAVDEFVKDLIRCASGLEALSLGGMDGLAKGSGVSYTYIHQVFGKRSIISSLRDLAPQLELLTDLSLHDVATAEMEALTELAQRQKNALRLKKLGIVVECLHLTQSKQEFMTSIYGFLLTQSSTLRGLEIKQNVLLYWITQPQIRVPKMERLNSFSGTTKGRHNFICEFEEGSLAANFPNLRSFGCVNLSNGPGNHNLPLPNADADSLRHDGITDLKFKNTCTTLAVFSQLGSFYPSVIHAHILLEGKLGVFNTIWSAWPTLQTLKLECKGNGIRQFDVLELDELLSGVPSMRLNDLKQALESDADPTVDNLRDLWQRYKTMPGLGDLKHLRKLDIEIVDEYVSGVFNQYCACNVSDIGGYFGFAMTNSLQYLTLKIPAPRNGASAPDAYQGNTISTGCRAMIRQVLGPHAVIQIQ